MGALKPNWLRLTTRVQLQGGELMMTDGGRRGVHTSRAAPTDWILSLDSFLLLLPGVCLGVKERVLTCPSSMSLCRPERSCSVLLVRRIDRLWDFLFCFCWRAAALLPLSTGIAASKTRCNHSLKEEKSQERRWLKGQVTKGLVEMICFTPRHRWQLCCTWLCLCLAASTRECVKRQSGGVWNWVLPSVRTQQTLGENLKVAHDEEDEECATITELFFPFRRFVGWDEML